MAGISIKHEGLWTNRLSREPLEQAFAEEWKRIGPNTLPYLLYGQDKSRHALKPKDARIAATIIQWLGSPCGEEFIRDVLKSKSSR